MIILVFVRTVNLRYMIETYLSIKYLRTSMKLFKKEDCTDRLWLLTQESNLEFTEGSCVFDH